MLQTLRNVLVVLCLLLATVLPPGAFANAPATPLASTLKPADFSAEALLIVHYHRFDGKFDAWNLWSWAQGQDGAGYPFAGTTPFGRYAVVPFARKPESAGIIVRKGEWLQKDIDRDRFVSFGPRDVAEVWLVSGDDTIYTDPSRIDLSVKPIAAFLDAPDRITFAASGLLSDAEKSALQLRTRSGGKAPTLAAVEQVDSPASTRVIYSVRLGGLVTADQLSDLELVLEGHPPLTVFAREVLTSAAYSPLDARLGYQYTPQKTTFTTWSPVSASVELLLYGSTEDAKPKSVVPMRKGEQGLWSAEIPGDLHGTPYRYRFTSYGKAREVPDIHTHAANYNSKFSIVMDLSRLAPKGWGNTAAPVLKQPTDEIIYEIHVRDFSIADPATPENLRGTYLGLVRENPATNGRPSSGLTHLKDLGVTAVHLLPIHDYTAEIGEYNWGYWTALFNVPEANYATEPRNPEAPIRELRQAIQTLHRSGIRVILDVVYNHTSSSGEYSPFEQTVPYYYFRTSPDGRMLNDAGVGNSVADERPMVRKYIVDSLVFWTNNYRIDGYRFDLLGTHHPETVREIERTLLAIRPDLTLYGEPWTGGGPIHFGKGAQKGLRMAVFNDHFRNALRGDLDGTTPGFATGPGGDVASVRNGIAGAIDDFTENPTETINYASAHDNTILWDKLVNTNPDASDAELRQMQAFAQSVVLLSQGIPFLHGGCDFARTKNGNHNSYNAGDEVNRFDWARKAEYQSVHDYLRGIIAIRKSQPGLRLTTRDQIREQLKFLDPQPEGVVVYTVPAAEAGKTLLIALSGNAAPTEITLPEGTWSVLADATRSGTTVLRTESGKVTLPAFSVLVAQK